jgi:hypothetical protein
MILSPRLLLRANPQVIPLRQARHIARARGRNDESDRPDVGGRPWIFSEFFSENRHLRPLNIQICPFSPMKTCFREDADDGIRTHTPLSRERILSPLRLPFRHIGAVQTSDVVQELYDEKV